MNLRLNWHKGGRYKFYLYDIKLKQKISDVPDYIVKQVVLEFGNKTLKETFKGRNGKKAAKNVYEYMHGKKMENIVCRDSDGHSGYILSIQKCEVGDLIALVLNGNVGRLLFAFKGYDKKKRKYVIQNYCTEKLFYLDKNKKVFQKFYID